MRRKGLFRLIAVATVAVVIGFASQAGATTNVPLHQTPPILAKNFDPNNQCDGFGTLSANQDGWHFVTTGQSSFVKLTLTFGTPGGDVQVVITSTNSASPDTGTGWKGWLDNAGAAEKHAYVITDAGWSLKAGNADVDGTLGENQDWFNLSHTCAGTPATPSPSPSPQASSSTDPGSPTPSSSNGDHLPKTGEAITTIALSGLAAIVAGAGVLFILRRRREALMSSSDE